MSESDNGVIWRGKPWVVPAIVARTAGVVVLGIIALETLVFLRVAMNSLQGFPLYVWAFGFMGVAWLASILRLAFTRASNSYVLRQSSMEVDRGIVGRQYLVVSPSAFSELEVDQGVIGRVLNYGSVAVRSQGGQQLTLRLIRDPKEVSTKIREVMTTPMVRVEKDGQAWQSRL
ncbi:MAG: PH domain-containing protein [Nitrososphaerota archaeon]|nr:PH domain-containing protein [Nitrososphaerota archaeon]